MATIKIVGNIAVIESSVNLDTLRTLKKHRPAALCLTNEDKDVVFAVSPTNGKGSINEYGASFGQR